MIHLAVRDFRFIVNKGTPTSWDVTRYFEYRDQELSGVPPDLSTMLQDGRYQPGTPDSFWHAQLVSLHAEGALIKLSFLSDSGECVYEFSYSNVLKVRNSFDIISARPSLVMQELTLMKAGNFRHALSDLGGRALVIYCGAMNFMEHRRH